MNPVFLPKFLHLAASPVGVVSAAASESGVLTIDASSSTTLHTLSLTENITSWTFTGLPASGQYRDIEVQITQHASAAKTCVSPATSTCTAGGSWTQSATLGAVEVLGIRVFSDGTRHLFPSGVFE